MISELEEVCLKNPHHYSQERHCDKVLCQVVGVRTKLQWRGEPHPAVLLGGLPWVTKERGLLKGTKVLGAESSQFSREHREPCSRLVSHTTPSPMVGVCPWKSWGRGLNSNPFFAHPPQTVHFSLGLPFPLICKVGLTAQSQGLLKP